MSGQSDRARQASRRAANSRPAVRSRPRLELLEDRTLLSGVSFSSAVSYGVGTNPVSMAVGDFNGDGKLDLAVANEYSNSVSVLLGNGDGTFQAAKTSPPDRSYLTSVAVGDFNGDGKPDLAVANARRAAPSACCWATATAPSRPPRTSPPGRFCLRGGGRLQRRRQARPGRGERQRAATSACCWATATAPSRPPRTSPSAAIRTPWRWGTSTATASSTWPWRTTAASVSVLLGNGDGTFQAAQNFRRRRRSGDSVAVGDFNGDGKLDLAVANIQQLAGNVSVLLGNGDGTFQAAQNFDAGDRGPASVAVGDFNGDGKPDLARGERSSRATASSVLLGNGDGTFQTAQNFAAGSSPVSVAVGDFNGDGKPDLAVANLNRKQHRQRAAEPARDDDGRERPHQLDLRPVGHLHRHRHERRRPGDRRHRHLPGRQHAPSAPRCHSTPTARPPSASRR